MVALLVQRVARAYPRVSKMAATTLLGAVGSLGLTGCETTAPSTSSPLDFAQTQGEPEVQRLREGNDIRISFPGAPNLDTAQKIRPDGRITLFIIGELAVAGMTPSELEQELLRRYEGQLASREVSVTVLQSVFTIWVGGAVASPGKIQSDRPLTVLEAIMEVGGFQGDNARTREVVVMRTEDGKIRRFTVNVQDLLDGRSNDAFLLRPSDIVFVPKKVSWM